jgi:PadR family transcriptional regulator PadR
MPHMAMPNSDMPAGALILLILRVLRSGPLHGYAIAQRIHQLSADALRVEEGSLYPALQKILRNGWARAAWGTSDTNRRVRFYTLTKDGVKQLEEALAGYERQTQAIQAVLRLA